jgi:hypothetical protein
MLFQTEQYQVKLFNLGIDDCFGMFEKEDGRSSSK